MAGILQVRLGGFGGQGVVLAGVLLGHAGALEGKHVSVANSYGAAARGSACKSEVIFSEGPIDFPHLLAADIFVAMSQGAYTEYIKEVKAGSGLVLVDRTFVIPGEVSGITQMGIAATDSAIGKLKEKQVANIVLLGALLETTRIVSPQAMRKAIRIHMVEPFRSLNLKALALGEKLGRQAHG